MADQIKSDTPKYGQLVKEAKIAID